MVREGARALGSYLPVLGAALVSVRSPKAACDKLLPPLVWTVCLAAQLLPPTPVPAPRGHFREAAAMGCLGNQLREGDR